MKTKATSICAVAAFLSATLFLALCHAFTSKEMCASEEGVRICVQMKGPCDVGHLTPRETSDLKMEMLHISIWNNSSRRINISPHDFYSVTVEGQILAMDRALFDSIEFKGKLREKELAPQEELSGFLFFPSCMGAIRGLVHGGYPYIEIQFF